MWTREYYFKCYFIIFFLWLSKCPFALLLKRTKHLSIFFYLQVKTENPEESDWKDTHRHPPQLRLSLMRSLQVVASYRYFLEMFWAILLIVRVEI